MPVEISHHLKTEQNDINLKQSLKYKKSQVYPLNFQGAECFRKLNPIPPIALRADSKNRLRQMSPPA